VCQGTTTVALIAWTEDLGSGRIQIETRAGDGPAATAPWLIADGKTTGLVPAVELVKSLLGETRLVVRAPTAGGGFTTGSFDITGVDAALADVRSGCGW
jgi:type VI secretion system VasI family protein